MTAEKTNPEKTNPESKRISPQDIKAHKKKDAPLVCLTAYTAPMAKMLDEHCDILLVGDSLAMVLYGLESTRGVDLETMIRHGQAVMRSAKQACVIVDLPYGSYEHSARLAYESAHKVMSETGAQAVKLEGGENMQETIRYLTTHDIPVMAHIGLLPQSVEDGKFRIQGKTKEQEEQLLRDIKAIEEAGAFAVVIEGIISGMGKKLSKAVSIPTIGIGASAACDGQVLVTEDMLGMLERSPKFAKKYANLRRSITSAAKKYALEVKSREFPSDDYLYTKTS